MNISFVSDTHPFCCVGILCSELDQLERFMEQSGCSFPYNIGVAIRCLPDEIGRKTFRRFDKLNNSLTLDITVSYEEYQLISKNEQRERLGILLYGYIEASLRKYKVASKIEQEQLLHEIKTWMLEHNWLDGKINKARAMIDSDINLYDISNQLGFSLEEVEDIFLRRNGQEPNGIHNDNKYIIDI